MSDKVSVEAAICYPKILNEVGKPERFTAMFLFKKEAVNALMPEFDKYLAVEKKAVLQLKEIDRSTFRSLPYEYTHYMNMSSQTKFLRITDIRQNDLSHEEVSFGDLVFLMCVPTVTTQHATSKKFVTAFLNNMAVIKSKAVDVSAKDPDEDDFMAKLSTYKVDEFEAL